MKNPFSVFVFSILILASFSACGPKPSSEASLQETPEIAAKDEAFQPYQSEEEISVEDLVEGTYVVNTDWGDPSIMEPINDTNNKFGSSITGIFPKKPWWDNAAYGKINLNYEIVAVDGQSYMQLTSRKLSPTSRVLGQVRIDDVPPAEEKTMYKLDALIKGPAGAQFNYRFAGKITEGSFPAGFGWEHIKKTIVVEAGTKPSFLLALPATIDSGVYGIKHVKIEKIPMSDIEQATKELYKDGYPTNLLRTTSFPLGRPSSMSFRGGVRSCNPCSGRTVRPILTRRVGLPACRPLRSGMIWKTTSALAPGLRGSFLRVSKCSHRHFEFRSVMSRTSLASI